MSAVRYLTSLSFIMSSSWIEEATHRPFASDPDILEDLGRWSLGFECWCSRCEKEQERWKRGVGLGPFIKRMNIKRPPHGRSELA